MELKKRNSNNFKIDSSIFYTTAKSVGTHPKIVIPVIPGVITGSLSTYMVSNYGMSAEMLLILCKLIMNMPGLER